MTKPTITTEQRDVLYEEILVRITGIGDVLMAIEREDFDKAQHLADEFADYLRLLTDDLGWGDVPAGSVELNSPPGVIRRAMERLIRRAEYEDREVEEERVALQQRAERNKLMRLTCDQLLAEVAADS
jgi:hypothetical protein